MAFLFQAISRKGLRVFIACKNHEKFLGFDGIIFESRGAKNHDGPIRAIKVRCLRIENCLAVLRRKIKPHLINRGPAVLAIFKANKFREVFGIARKVYVL